ncbi:hypothetical protein AA105894_3036 [Asaia spathodeae NBRC 105894]|nr:hypothetical protein AA105894_3036 [Asaia spathodeae NBRC 105894]
MARLIRERAHAAGRDVQQIFDAACAIGQTEGWLVGGIDHDAGPAMVLSQIPRQESSTRAPANDRDIVDLCHDLPHCFL